MANRGDPEGLRITTSNHRERLSCERARLDEMSAAFDRMNTYFQDSTMIINVRRMHMPVMTIASLRRILLSDAEEGELWQEIGPLMSNSGVPHARPRRGVSAGRLNILRRVRDDPHGNLPCHSLQSWAQCGNGNDADAVRSLVAVSTTRDHDEGSGFTVSVMVDFVGHAQQGGSCFICSILPQFDLNASPRTVGKLEDDIDLRTGPRVTPR